MFKQNQTGRNALRAIFDATGSRLGFLIESGSGGSLSFLGFARQAGFYGPEKNQSTIFSNKSILT